MREKQNRFPHNQRFKATWGNQKIHSTASVVESLENALALVVELMLNLYKRLPQSLNRNLLISLHLIITTGVKCSI